MCGIVGLVSPHRKASQEQIAAAMQMLEHRGPDDNGFYRNDEKTVAFGHQRLCIIDRSQAAHQPMVYQERFVLAYNGELYNYIELKKELQKKGFAFHSRSDSEVVVASYAAYGKDCLKQFDGAFAFAIWDQQERVFFAARDRMGEKPFYYHYDGEQLAFGSEMKALWQLGVHREVNAALLYNFLTIGYSADPFNPDATFYKQVRKLPAAHCLSFSFATNQLEIERYWQVSMEQDESISIPAAIEKCRLLITDSIKKRLRSDVAVGTSLSGGLDSSAIIAFCHQQNAAQYSHQCFTAVFPGYEKDEEAYATIVAKEFGLKHHLVHVESNGLPELMEKMMLAQDEPVGSASALVQYKVYEAARKKGVTVLLDGQGADELFGGYHKYYKWYWQELFNQRKLKSSKEYRAAKALGVAETFGWKNKLAAVLPQFSAALLESRKKKQALNHPDLDNIFAQHHKNDLAYLLPTEFDLNHALYADTFQYGLEELLRFADRNSMAHAVEVRLPYLSHELVSFLFSLPPHFKIKEGWTKWLLRKVAEPLLPAPIVWRRDKIGFEPPQKKWMEDKNVQESMMEGKKRLVQQGILNAHALNKKIKPHEAHAAASDDWRYWAASFLFHV